MKPIFIRDKKASPGIDRQGKQILVPCGLCPNCLARRASAWSFRLMQEEKVSSTAYFVTLTYDTNQLHFTRNGYQDLKKKDLQDFFKRLRKAQFGSAQGNLKYYAVGEYGGKLKRPHYHVILFNADLGLISKSWGLGHVHHGKVEEASVGYTLKYISKPQKGFGRNDDRTRPFSLMSKGLGLCYLTEEMIAWHRASMTERQYCNLLDGKKCAMPRYYKERIYSEDERQDITRQQRNKFAEDILRDLFKLSAKDHSKKMDRHHKSNRAKQINHDREVKKLYA